MSTVANSHHINPKTLLFLTFVYSIYATCALDITCDLDNTCNDQIISCNANENCTLYCDGGSVCQRATIIGPTDANLTVYCLNGNMYGVCRMTFIATNSTGLTLYCESKNACIYTVYTPTTVLCPTHGFCHVYCGSPKIRNFGINSIGFCNNMIIDAREMESGELRISSHGEENHHSMELATVYCPGNNLNCMVECGRYGCYSTNIRTQSDTAKLEIDALRIWALKDANIYCPLSGGSGSCIINASGAGPEMLTNTHIYTAKGLNQLSLSCNYNTTMNECYDALFPPTRILCEDGSGSGCMIELVSEEIDVWQCTDNLTTFVCPTLQPTQSPTSKSPTFETISTYWLSNTDDATASTDNKVTIKNKHISPPKNQFTIVAVLIIVIFAICFCIWFIIKFVNKTKSKSDHDQRQMQQVQIMNNNTIVKETKENALESTDDAPQKGLQLVHDTDTKSEPLSLNEEMEDLEVEGLNRNENNMNVKYNMNAEGDEVVVGDDEITSGNNMNAIDEFVVIGNDELIPGPLTSEGVDIAQCVDCGQFKEGRTYDGNGSFYCNECYDNYVNYTEEPQNITDGHETTY